ncbi:MAG: type II toxin-antitoxin system VapC family toxin [Betaproteobacteria bacterium]|nr:type II toxin-antitoxin system VapC family toxin [Betaproteobacteria bacterium]
MIALDTNLLARFYVDDPSDREAVGQRATARQIIATEPALFVPRTVLLELEWLLRGLYRLKPSTIVAVIDHLWRLPNVTVEDVDVVRAALHGYRAGMDFADALHLAAAHRCRGMFTFDDRRFARRARRLGLKPPVSVPAAAARRE